MTHPWDAFRAPKPPTEEVKPEPKREPGEPLRVKNYYALSIEEIDASIDAMRHWLWEFPTSDKYRKVMFALDIALNAKELKKDIEKDEFLKLVIDTVC
jgi:hypothetical protein